MSLWVDRLHRDFRAEESGECPAISTVFPELHKAGDRIEIKDDDPRLAQIEPWRRWMDADWDQIWARLYWRDLEDARSGKHQASPGDIFVAEQFWTEECTRVVRDAVARWGPHFSAFVSDDIQKLIPQNVLSRIPSLINTACQQGMWVHTLGNLISYYASDVAHGLGLTSALSNEPELRCSVCGRLTSVWVLSPSIIKRFSSIDDFARRPIGPQCFQNAFWHAGGGRSTRKRKTLIRRLQALGEALGGIPPAQYFSRADLFENIPPDIEHTAALVKALGEMPPRKCYDAVFGSWLEALHAAGILEGPYRETNRGVHCMASDGHLCYSLAEKMIDDWLTDQGIPHEREPKYPRDIDLNPQGTLRADWKVGEAYIEYFGLAGNEKYDEKTAKKIKLAQKANLILISLYQHELRNLGAVLTDRLSGNRS